MILGGGCSDPNPQVKIRLGLFQILLKLKRLLWLLAETFNKSHPQVLVNSHLDKLTPRESLTLPYDHDLGPAQASFATPVFVVEDPRLLFTKR